MMLASKIIYKCASNLTHNYFTLQILKAAEMTYLHTSLTAMFENTSRLRNDLYCVEWDVKP